MRSAFSSRAPMAQSVLFGIAISLSLVCAPSSAETELTEAEVLLTQRQSEFEQALIEVADGVHSAVGFGVSPTSMIEGRTGLIIVDTQIDNKAAESVLAAFRRITDKPVVGIIFTHGHRDHTGGASVFVADGRVSGREVHIWARRGFGEEARWLSDAGLTIQRLRGARQSGVLLPAEKRINNGVAQAYRPQFPLPPPVAATHLLKELRQTITIDGVELDLVAASGETRDQMYVWYAARKVVFSGDNFYKSWPNVYAIRGTGYRDIRAWAASIDAMLGEQPEHLVGGHTRPLSGQALVADTLTNYRDALHSVFEQTIEGMNSGMTPDELVEAVKLPEHLAQLDYLREYYGNVEWAVRSIFSGYLGWFDGNATNLFSLSRQDEAKQMAALAGGTHALHSAAREAIATNPQWSAQLCDHLLALDGDDARAMRLKADALEALARKLLTATGRNYYLTSAMQLRARADLAEQRAAQ